MRLVRGPSRPSVRLGPAGAKPGIRRQHVEALGSVSTEWLSDAQRVGDAVARALALAGAVFLASYGWQALRRARHANALQASRTGAGLHLSAALAQAAAFTLLNPHVYLDTVLLVGSIGAQHAAPLRPWFVAGASAASLVWFTALGFGARWLAPWFARPRAWQILDALIGLTMAVLAILLVQHALATW